MPLTTTADWLQGADQDMLGVLKNEPIPQDLTSCRPDQRPEGWQAIFRRYLTKEFATENLDFLKDVDSYRGAQHNAEFALKIYNDYVKDGADIGQINIRNDNRHALVAFFGGQPPTRDQLDAADGDPDLFETACDEVRQMLDPVVRNRFKDVAGQVKKELLTPVQPKPEDVKAWNETALTALRTGQSTQFVQVNDLVLVTNPAAGSPPGLAWAQLQAGVVLGQITMTQKGGIRGRGSITATGVRNEGVFEEAIARFSKKEVIFGTEPVPQTGAQRVSPFGARSGQAVQREPVSASSGKSGPAGVPATRTNPFAKKG
jgi:hypothetical protein